MTAVLIWGLRLIVALVVLRVVFRAIGGRRTAQARSGARLGGTLVRDPHCGTYLPPARALALTTTGGVLHFCSDRCRAAWTAAHPR